MSKMIEEDSLKVPLKNNHVSSTLSHRTNSAQSPAMLTKESSILTLTKSLTTTLMFDETEEDTLSLNHQKIARTTAFFSAILMGIALALNTLQVSELDQCDSSTYDCDVVFRWDHLETAVANRPHGEKEHINYFRDCTNVGNDDDSYGHATTDFLTFGYNCAHLQIGGATWLGAGIASLLFTVLSIALTVSSNNRMYIMPRHGSSKRFFYNFFNVASVIFSVLSCLGFYGLNFHDPYDGHAWKREWIGSSGKFMIAASTSRLLGILWSFISDKCCSSSDVSTDSFFVPYEEFAEDDKKRKLKYGELKRRRQLCCAFLTCSLLISILACTLFPVIINGVVKSGLRDYAVIGSEKSSGFDQFANRSYTGDDFLYVSAFNITNPYEMLEGAKPAVEELGPFVFKKYQYRYNVTWDKQNDTMEYRQHNFYVFDAEQTRIKTNGRFDSDDVEILTVNMVFLAMQSQIGDAYWHIVCDYLLWKDDFDRLFTSKTILELMNGYEVDVEILGAKIPIQFPGIYPNYTKKELDPTYVNPSIMRVGESNEDDLFQLVQWRGMKSLTSECPWGANSLPGGKYCPNEWPCCQQKGKDNNVPTWLPGQVEGVFDEDANLVGGTLGEQFQMNLKKNSTVVAFTDTAFRKILLRNVNGLEVHWKGARLLRYTVDPTVLMNQTMLPSNRRYYNFGPSGFFANMSILEEGLTILPSLPHFLHGDPALVNAVEGMNPDAEKHELYLDVEPKSGSTSVAHQRAMVSVPLPDAQHWINQDDWFSDLRHGTVMPILWFDDASLPTQDGLQEIFTMYLGQSFAKYSFVIGLICTCIFSVLIAIEIYKYYVVIGREKRDVISDVSIVDEEKIDEK